MKCSRTVVNIVVSPYVIEYEGAFHLDPPPSVVWAVLTRTDCFEDWWAWLRALEVEGEGLRSGSVLRGVVVPPIPFKMRLDVVLEHCSRPRRIEAVVHGDLEGRARLDLAPDAGGTRAAVSWTIEMTQTPMRIAARFAHPLLRWGHDRVVEATVEGFRRTLATPSPPSDPTSAGSARPADQPQLRRH